MDIVGKMGIEFRDVSMYAFDHLIRYSIYLSKSISLAIFKSISKDHNPPLTMFAFGRKTLQLVSSSLVNN